MSRPLFAFTPVFIPVLALILCTSSGCTLSMGMADQQRYAVQRENATSTSSTLKRLLETDDPQVRSLVAREIGQMGPAARDAIPALHRLIDDPDRHVRIEAAKALLQIEPGEPVAIPALVMIINDPQTTLEDRIVALNLLQNSGPKGQAALALHNASNAGANTSAAAYPTTRPGRTVRIEETNSTTYPRPVQRTIRANDVPPEPVRSEPAESDPPPADTTTEPRSEATTAPERTTVAAAGATATGATAAGATPVATTSLASPELTPPAPAAPTTRPATADSPGLTGLIAAANAPAPDIQLYGLTSYSSSQASAVRSWLERQSDLNEVERETRFKDFHRWRTEQDRRIYQRALER